MKRRQVRSRPRQINILQTTTRKAPSRQHYAQLGFWAAVIMAMLVAVGFALHLGIGVLLDRVLYQNPRYTLQKIEIQPEKFSPSTIRQAAGLVLGQSNLWSLSLPEIKRDVEKLPYVSSATVERHFPDRVAIKIVERVPVVKIFAINEDLNTREMFYLDRECVVLKPRDNEPPPSPPLPEVIGLVNAEVEPGVRLEQSALTKALQILEAINHISTLNTTIDIRTIDLSQPLAIRMVTTRDMAITFRLDYIDQQLARLDTILNRFSSDARTIHTVDLTPDRYVPVTFYE
jgi:cell division septal protein FtsQ